MAATAPIFWTAFTEPRILILMMKSAIQQWFLTFHAQVPEPFYYFWTNYIFLIHLFPLFLKTKYPNVIFNSDKSFHQFRIPNVRTFIMNIFQPFKLRKSGGKISETNWKKQLMNFWENNRIQKLFLFKIHLWNYLFICRASWWGLERHARNYFRRSVPILFSYLGYQ